MSFTSAVPVGQPLYGASFGQSVKRFFQGYVKFSGRASRSEFWWAMLFTFLLALVVQIPFWVVWSMVMVRAATAAASASTGDPVSTSALDQELLGYSGLMLLVIVMMAVASLAIVLPTYAVMWRRLQDANFHGAFALLSLIGLSIVPVIMCFFPTSAQGARFDPAHSGLVAAYGYDQPYASTPAYGQPGPYGPLAPSPAYGEPGSGQQPYGQPYSQGYQQGATSPIPQTYGGQSYGGTPYGQQTEDRPQQQQ